MAFKVGEIVQLRSGGPKMTVTAVHTSDSLSLRSDSASYSTSWFAGAKLEHGRFPEESLMAAKVDDTK
jgi:uncharacterized protein YodC (DUF2158 family)